MMIILNLLSFFLFSIIFIALFSNKHLRLALSLLFSLFLCLQASSLLIGGNFIDYKYYVHFDLSALSMIAGFKKQSIIIALLFVGLPYILYYLGTRLHHVLEKSTHAQRKNRIASNSNINKGVILVICLSILCAKEGMFAKLKEVYDIVYAEQELSPISNTLLTQKEHLQVNADSAKNIIIISLESFERAFLHDSNQHLTPKLRA
ncbi:MAG: hypothetical protein ACRCSG_05760, partial [Cellulosilyticaceae bacterium]